MNLGIVQTTTKKFIEAEQSYLMALYHRHRYADCYFNLGNMVRGLLTFIEITCIEVPMTLLKSQRETLK